MINFEQLKNVLINLKDKCKVFFKKLNFDITLSKFIFIYSATLLLFNFSLFKDIYIITNSVLYLFGSFFVAYFLLIFFNTIILNKYTTKFLSILIWLISTGALYFSNTYNVLIDKVMILNVFETNVSETMELLNIKFCLYLFFIGLLPSIIILKLKIKYKNFCKEFLLKILMLVSSLFIILAFVFINYKNTSSYIRNNRYLKYKFIPMNWIDSTYSILNRMLSNKISSNFEKLSEDAIIDNNINKNGKKNILIFVVGEAARADNFSHDNIFHSFLGLFNIKTKYYNQDLDLFNSCKN